MPPPRLDGIFERLRRAQENFNIFDAEHTEYVSQQPAPCRVVINIESGDRGVARIKLADIPAHWRLLIADIVCDLRFVLDNLAYELVIANTNQDPPTNPERIEFPIFSDKQVFMEKSGKGIPTRRSGLAKICNMDPWVQGVIESIQPYNSATPDDDGLFLLHEMTNTYKHRLLTPVLLSVEQIRYEFTGTNCSITEIMRYKISNMLKDGAVVTTFRLVANGKGPAKIDVKVQPSFYVGFPPGTVADGFKVWELAHNSIHVVRAIIAILTELQWGSPMDLPRTPPHFGVPLRAVIANPYK